MSVVQITLHMICACVVLACGFLLYSRSLMGGGDAKLLAAASLWFGFENLLPFLAATALAGGVLSLAYLAFSAAKVGLGQGSVIARTVPYGAAIAAGGLTVLPDWLASL